MADRLEILLKECRNGKAGSQEELYRRFSSAMFALCLQYASNEEDAKDILQDGFIKVFAKLDQVQNPKALPGWIRRVMLNTALEKYRGQVHLNQIDELRGDAEEDSGNHVFEELTCEELVALIRELSPRYRLVFNLYAIEGYSHQEISEELGISVGTSKSNLSRARTILKERIRLLYGTEIVR